MPKFEFITPIPNSSRGNGAPICRTEVIQAGSHSEAMSKFLAKNTTFYQRGFVPDPQKGKKS